MEKRFKIRSPQWKALTEEEQEALLDEAATFKEKVTSGEIHPCRDNAKLPTLILFSGKA